MHPSLPRPVRIVLVLATIASLLAMPSLTSAAPKGSKLTVVVNALMPAVSPNMDGAFDVVVTNGGNASLTHATLTVDADDVKSAPAECDANLICDLGTLVSKDVRTLRFVVGAPAMGSAVLSAGLQVDAGSGNPSQDATSDAGEITVNDSDAFFATWQGAGDPVELADENAAITNGHQHASVVVPAVAFDYAAQLTMTNDRVCGERGIGQAVEMHFANGLPVAVDGFMTVTVKYDDEARGNRTPGNVGFVHDPDIGDCTPLVKGCLTAGCFNAWWEGTGPNKLLVIEARLASNGLGKGL